MLRFLAIEIWREKNACIAAAAKSSCCAFPLHFPEGEIPVAQTGSVVSLVEQKKIKQKKKSQRALQSENLKHSAELPSLSARLAALVLPQHFSDKLVSSHKKRRRFCAVNAFRNQAQGAL